MVRIFYSYVDYVTETVVHIYKDLNMSLQEVEWMLRDLENPIDHPYLLEIEGIKEI